MAEDYLSDREQEEALRNWWSENWRWIFGGVVLGLAILVGWRYTQTQREERAHRGAEQYSAIQAALSSENAARAAELLKGLSDDFAASPYTQQARLLMAKSHVDQGELEAAAPLLRAAMEQAKDEELARVARSRLARVLVQQGKPDEALQLLDTRKAGEFVAREREIRGDAYIVKGDSEAARAEYAAALAGGTAQVDRTLLELKLQEAGGAAAPALDSAQSSAPLEE